METNPQTELAFDFLQYTGTNVFLTGRAGTGKTTFLKRLKAVSPKRMIVLAPTGVAAINAGGVTIHSFFQLPFGPYVPGAPTGNSAQNGMVNRFSKMKIDIMRSIDLLVIDEISMVRADLLDAVSDVLCRYRDRNRPFGGVQLLMIGDLRQLAPVVKDDEWELLKNDYPSPFFFNSRALQGTSYVSIELTHVYRQTDHAFIDLLNRIRDNRMDGETVRELNRRCLPDFVPDDEDGYITLTTHNYQAQRLNQQKLDDLPGKAHIFTADISGNFPEYAFPTDQQLMLKEGAQVMFVRNDSSPEKRYYNGKIGRISSIGGKITVRCGEQEIEVVPEEWSNTKYTIDPESKEIRETVEGTFRQYPLKAAWAITIHKSQGLTFERAVIDAGAAFTHGQVYVALSRCKTFDGLVLRSPIGRDAVINDPAIKNFNEYVETHQPGDEQLEAAQRGYFLELLVELFNHTPLFHRTAAMARLFNDHLAGLYPEMTERWRSAREACHTEMADVGDKFGVQLRRLVMESADYGNDEVICERVAKGVSYFLRQFEGSIDPLREKGVPEIDNKDTRRAVEEAYARFRQEARVKKTILNACAGNFSVKHYLKVKAMALLEEVPGKDRRETQKIEISEDILNPLLYKALAAWRKTEAEKLKLPVYTILQQKALIGISNTLPTGSKELLRIPGIGKKVLEKHGMKLLEIVDGFRFSAGESKE